MLYYSNNLFPWQAKVHDLAGDDYRSSVLASIKGWIQVALLSCSHSVIFFTLKLLNINKFSINSLFSMMLPQYM